MTDDQLNAAFESLRKDIQQVKQEVREDIQQVKQELREEIQQARDESIAQAREMQTEVLRYIGNVGEGFNVRMRHVEANLGNFETAERMRLASIEERLLRVELKVLGQQVMRHA